MPLVQLLQNLQNFNYYSGGPGNFIQKKLPYGYDQPGRLSSQEPYVRFPLPDNASQSVLAYYQGNRASLDFPVRGGSLQTIQNGVVVPRAAVYDVQRIQRFLKTDPKGFIFITKQIGLQLSNPKLEVGQQANLNPGTGGTTSRFLGLIENTRIYNGGLNTLAQVAVQGSGLHADRHGLIPYNPDSGTYEKVVASYNIKDNGAGNRLVVLLYNKVLGGNRTTTNPTNIADPVNARYFSNLDNLIRLGIPKSNENILFQYPGGPGSVNGIGLTTIRRYQNTNDLYNVNIPNQAAPLQSIFTATTREQATGLGYVASIDRAIQEEAGGVINSRLVILTENLVSGRTNSPIPFNRAVSRPQDNTELYRILEGQDEIVLRKAVDTKTATDTQTQLVKDSPSNNNAITFNYNDFYSLKREDSYRVKKQFTDFRKKIATSGSATLPTVNYQEKDMVKRIGVSDAGSGKTGVEGADKVNIAGIGVDYDSAQGRGDLVKFRFTSLEYGANGVVEVPLIFRAYITNFQDSHTAETSNFRYTGRGENFYVYNGFNRAISFAFTVAIQSAAEFTPLYNKVKYLLSQVYPDYSPAGFMRTPITKLTIGRYLYDQPGIIDNLTVAVNDNYPWEIDFNNEPDVFEAPQILDISCRFTPIHSFLPRRSNPARIVPIITGK